MRASPHPDPARAPPPWPRRPRRLPAGLGVGHKRPPPSRTAHTNRRRAFPRRATHSERVRCGRREREADFSGRSPRPGVGSAPARSMVRAAGLHPRPRRAECGVELVSDRGEGDGRDLAGLPGFGSAIGDGAAGPASSASASGPRWEGSLSASLSELPSSSVHDRPVSSSVSALWSGVRGGGGEARAMPTQPLACTPSHHRPRPHHPPPPRRSRRSHPHRRSSSGWPGPHGSEGVAPPCARRSCTRPPSFDRSPRHPRHSRQRQPAAGAVCRQAPLPRVSATPRTMAWAFEPIELMKSDMLGSVQMACTRERMLCPLSPYLAATARMRPESSTEACDRNEDGPSEWREPRGDWGGWEGDRCNILCGRLLGGPSPLGHPPQRWPSTFSQVKSLVAVADQKSLSPRPPWGTE